MLKSEWIWGPGETRSYKAWSLGGAGPGEMTWRDEVWYGLASKGWGNLGKGPGETRCYRAGSLGCDRPRKMNWRDQFCYDLASGGWETWERDLARPFLLWSGLWRVGDLEKGLGETSSAMVWPLEGWGNLGKGLGETRAAKAGLWVGGGPGKGTWRDQGC